MLQLGCQIPMSNFGRDIYHLCNAFEWYTVEYPASNLCFLGTHTRKVLYNYFKVRWNTDEYTTAFLHLDWPHFLWHGISIQCIHIYNISLIIHKLNSHVYKPLYMYLVMFDLSPKEVLGECANNAIIAYFQMKRSLNKGRL